MWSKTRKALYDRLAPSLKGKGSLVDYITVSGKDDLQFTLACGMEVQGWRCRRKYSSR